MKLLMFTKHLQDLPLEKMADVVRDLGFDGLDVTTRTGGTIAPESVTEDLPRVIDVCAARGLEVGMLTTEITGPDHDHAESIFQAASDAGIKFLKLGYFRYGDFGGLSRQLDEIRGRLEGLAPMARRYGVTVCVHTHSGDTVPPSGELLYLLLAGIRRGRDRRLRRPRPHDDRGRSLGMEDGPGPSRPADQARGR